MSLYVNATSRQEFSGQTDKYAFRSSSMVPTERALALAKQGVAPLDVAGLLPVTYQTAASTRLARYSEYWRWFDGNHWPQAPYEDGEAKAYFNLCERVACLASDWMTGESGWTCTTEDGQNNGVADLANGIWEGSGPNAVLAAVSDQGVISGDAFLFVSAITTSPAGRDLPRSQWVPRVIPINPAFAFPIWHATIPGIMVAAVIQFPLLDKEGAERLYSLVIYPDRWETYEDSVLVDTKPNFFGEVNLVHIANQRTANSVFGVSDLAHVCLLNQEYNRSIQQIRRIMRYHAEPTTLIFGARVGCMERGADRIWSNLPVEARVENLKLDANLQDTYAYLDRLLNMVCVASSTPKLALDPDGLHISNTTGIALRLMFSPLERKTARRKARGFVQGFSAATRLLLKAAEYCGIDVASLADDPDSRYELLPRFSSALPADETTATDVLLKKLSGGLTSKAEAVRQANRGVSYERLALEMAADSFSSLAGSREKYQATVGASPSLSAACLDSRFLGYDLTGVLPSEASVVSSEDKSEDSDENEVE